MQVKTHYQSAALLLGLLSSPANADSINTKAGFIDFNLYPYLNSVDSDSSATVNIAASLAHRFSYFSLTNFANQAGKSELEEFESLCVVESPAKTESLTIIVLARAQVELQCEIQW